MFAGDLSSYHLLYTARVDTTIELDKHSGSALRGALYNALLAKFCANRAAPSCGMCPLRDTCPVSALVAPLRDDNARGRDTPRPFVIHPPLAGVKCYQPGDRLVFGITLFGSIISLLPYLILAVEAFEEEGLVREFHRGQRGRFSICTIESYHPFTGARSVIYDASQARVDVPTICVTPADVAAKAATLPSDGLTLHFLTPVRLIEGHQEASRALFRTLVQRLSERLSALERAYGESRGEGERADWRRALIEQSSGIETHDDMLTWETLRSWSNRQSREMPIGGFLGQVTYLGDVSPFRELLTWGEVINVGKASAKGNGWFTITPPVPVARLFIA